MSSTPWWSSDDLPISIWIRWAPGADSECENLLREVARPGRGPEHGPRAAASVRLPVPGALLHQPYLAISTGGTTGVAKSAVHSQYSYGACAMNYLAEARIRETDVYLMLGQLFHVVGYMPLAYLAMGRPVVIASFDPARLIEVIEQERVSGFFAIATMLPRMIAAVKASPSPARAVSSVRQVEYGGAPTGEAVVRDAASVLTRIWFRHGG
jgi:acyl-coenzyme A synthetase/AMP-(fatty) acid ligase